MTGKASVTNLEMLSLSLASEFDPGSAASGSVFQATYEIPSHASSSDIYGNGPGGAASSASGSFTHQAVAVSPHSLGTVDPDDLPWLTHPRLVHASLATQRAVQALTSAKRTTMRSRKCTKISEGSRTCTH